MLTLSEENAISEKISEPPKDIKKTTSKINIEPTESLPLVSAPPNIPYLKATKNLLIEGWPFLASRLIEVGTDYVGVVMLARIDPETLAASSLIATSQFLVRSVNGAALYNTAIKAATLKSQDIQANLGITLKASWIFAIVISIPSTALAIFSKSIFDTFGIIEATSNITQNYLRAYATGIWLTLMSISNQQFAIGLGHPLLVLGITALARPFLLGFGYAFIFGKFGLPKFGVAGLGYAYSISYAVYFLSFMMAFRFKKSFSDWQLTFDGWRDTFVVLKELVIKGLPIGAYTLIELGSLSFASVLIGRTNNTNLAALQPALQYGSFLANATFAIATTLGVVVKREIEMFEHVNAMRYHMIGTLICVGIPSIFTIIFCTTNNLLVKPFLDNSVANRQDIINMAYYLVIINLIGQIFDGIRNAITGTMRGFGDTKTAMFVNIICMLLVNVPIACIFAFVPVLKDMQGTINNSDGILFARSLSIAVSTLILYMVFTNKRAVDTTPDHIERTTEKSKSRWCGFFASSESETPILTETVEQQDSIAEHESKLLASLKRTSSYG